MSRIADLLRLYIDSGVDVFLEDAAVDRISPQKVILEDRRDSMIPTDLDSICNELRAFDGCEIKKAAINTVIYDGNPSAKIMLIGEAPGASEDEQGIPFCGQSGKLLDNILNSIDLTRKSDVFITNTVFWRPPGNRRPTSDEIMACKPFLEKIIYIVRPKLIILVGSTAVESLLNEKSISMNSLRGRYHSYLNRYLDKPIPTTTIFHPSYLLRQPGQKKAMWFDILNIESMINKILI